jgi:hypothetical protein
MKLNVVPARTGFLWVKLGIRTFFQQPLALAGLFFMYMATVIMLAQIPVIGPLVAGLLMPAASLGLMAATAEATKGRFPMPTVLISAFRAGRQRVRAMLVLGAIYTASSVLITQLAALVTGGGEVVANQVNTATLVALALHAPLFVMFWHAPALVHWHGVAPIKSLFFSTVACLRNFGALTVYGLSWLVVYVGVISLFGLVGGLIGGAGMAQAMAVPTTVMVAAMMSTSLYFTFRDSFTADPEPSPQPTGELT